MILHTLNRSPLESTVYRQALRALADGDSLLLIEDGVLGALPSTSATGLTHDHYQESG
ncbi:DsrH/TusB family sulfur metabolism protein [Halomonas litopenaei]|uniref:DsrH/TusB family sulfur metabolism protein n=1 Tax=Halomonas litopenaei TaxID=2109328 RepID=UPI003F9FD66A